MARVAAVVTEARYSVFDADFLPLSDRSAGRRIGAIAPRRRAAKNERDF